MAQPDACSTCGTAAKAGQEYCLACGSRIVPTRRLGAFGDAWERRLGRYPGDWAVAAVLLLLVAAGSAAAGIAAGDGTGDRSGSRTIVAISPVVAAPPAPLPETQPVTTAPPPRPAPKPRPGLKPPEPEVAVWPARDGYTVVLASIPARGKGLARARAKAKEAKSRGVSGVGVLLSGGFSSLHPGYYVIFAGVYGSLDQAETVAHALSGKYPNAYARQVTH
jgi:hypothetical protein